MTDTGWYSTWIWRGDEHLLPSGGTARMTGGSGCCFQESNVHWRWWRGIVAFIGLCDGLELEGYCLASPKTHEKEQSDDDQKNEGCETYTEPRTKCAPEI